MLFHRQTFREMDFAYAHRKQDAVCGKMEGRHGKNRDAFYPGSGGIRSARVRQLGCEKWKVVVKGK